MAAVARSVAARYGVVLAAVSLAVAVRWALVPVLGSGWPYISLYPAIMLSAWYGGLWPGLFATALGSIEVLLWPIAPAQSPASIVSLPLYLFNGIAISALTELLDRARRREIELHQAAHRMLARERDARAASESPSSMDSLRLFRLSIDQAGDAIFFARPEGRLFDVNETACRQLGYTHEQLTAMNVWDVDPDHAEQHWPVHWEELKARRRLRFESRHRRRDGSTFPVEVAVQYLKNGEREFACGLARDISERRQAQTALARSENRFRTIFDCINDAIFIHDPGTGTILDVNRRMCEMYGYSREEALRLEVGALSSGDPPYSQKDAVARVQKAAAGEPQLFEWHARHRDGHLFWVEVNMRCAKLGEQDHIMVTARDISDRHHLQMQLRQRTEELALQAERKDFFLGMLSHELRNPLAPILTSLYLLDRADVPADKSIKAKAVLHRQVGQLRRLVDDLLDVTRIGRGKIALRLAECDIAGLLRQSTDDHRNLMEERNIELSVSVPGEPVRMMCDATRLSQVFGNLIRNAIKFTPAGGRVSVSMAIVESGVEIRVTDTGRGIAPHLLHQVFEPFIQAERPLSGREGGLGLGLALAKGLVELHGGSISASSEGLGSGADFRIVLPLRASSRGAASAESDARKRAQPRRVLVVDDNRDAAESLADMLKLLGHQVELAFDGPAALEQARRRAPDVVLCDIGLPGMTGYEVVKALRAQRGSMRIVAVSGYAQPEDVKAARDAGFDRHIAKPASTDDIEAILSE